MRKYSTAMSRTSTGVPMASMSGRAMTRPMPISRRPPVIAIAMTVWMASDTSSMRPLPISVATTTFGPIDAPTRKFTKTPTFATLAPTAARASPPAKRPTTATSAELKKCCRILLAASGSANSTSFQKSPPCSISILFGFVSTGTPPKF